MSVNSVCRTGIFCLILFTFTNTVAAATYVLPAKGDIVGEIQFVNPQLGETLSEVGIRYNIGYYEMIRANPRVDFTRPLSPRTKLLIPSQFILPPGPHKGVVINLAEYRLYYYPSNDNVVITVPVGIGREGWNTPIGITKVTAKEKDPIWRPTANVRAEAAKNGTPIPNAFPPGEGNPLGRHILRLGWPTYLIHGTNRLDGVGSRVSAGCIRLMPDDIEYLFGQIEVGTPVQVLNEPVKFGHLNGVLYMQAHPLLIEQKNNNLVALAQQQLIKTTNKKLNQKIIAEELNAPTGIPRKIS